MIVFGAAESLTRRKWILRVVKWLMKRSVAKRFLMVEGGTP